jgi:glycerol uptake facilitator-like aquaporin
VLGLTGLEFFEEVMHANFKKKLASEFLGTLFLLTIIVGSGIMGERLSAGNAAIALLANSLATGCGLLTLIWIFGPISGAHFNPLVTVISFFQKHHSKKETIFYISVQVVAAVMGVMVAHVMFGENLVNLSTHNRSGFNQMFSEFIATFGLIMVIRGLSQNHNDKIPFAVAAYITSAYWFTSSTSFANPAVTIARSLTNTFSGIDPINVFGFIIAQIAGATCAEFTFRWFLKDSK